MESRGSSTPSAGPGTSSARRRVEAAYRGLPIRWRLAGGSAALTFAILAMFAGIVGTLTTRQIRSDFRDRVRNTANQLGDHMVVRPGGSPRCVGPNLDDFGSPDDAHIRILTLSGDLLCQTAGAPDLGFPRPGAVETKGFRVESREIPAPPLGRAILQYARPYAEINHTISKVRFFLLVGVFAGTALALLAGLAIARRAMRPIAQLTSTAREIERTRDPSRRIPTVGADDEVAELARTLGGMLGALDDARGETVAMLERQRAFVADASHELRTPLTSVLANLELLADQLDGEHGEAATSALRSSQRMRRLVGDLLLLARADAGRRAEHSPTDLGAVLLEAAAELEPVSADHHLIVDAQPVVIDGARDDLHRLMANLIENSIRHTPRGTSIRASTGLSGPGAQIVVEDDGPGVPDELAERIFERFVRRGGDRSGSSGLGLAIVRAVAEGHGGGVRLEHAQEGSGARFVVSLPGARLSAAAPELARA